MSCSSCATPFPTDATKRVDYSYGLVLGVSEFRTEQGYFLAKHRAHARALHGYGTIAGLGVSIDGSEVQVAPGLALDPQGREICVPEPQCARLEDWLAQRQADGDFSPPSGIAPPGPITAYVALRYRECETERVPIPAGPCLSLDRTAVPSRIQDAFELGILEEPPPQAEETAIRVLGDVLGHVRVGAGPGALTDPGPLLAELRALLEYSPPHGPSSPPQDLLLDPAHAGAILRAALRVWVTEVRPQLVPEGGGCLGGPRDPAWLYLARLDFSVKLVSGVLLVDGAVALDDSQRPVLVQTRVLQEFLAPSAGIGGEPAPAGPVVTPTLLAFAGRAAASPVSLSFPAASATPLSGSTPLVVDDQLPAMQFKAKGSVVSIAALPPALGGGPLAVRLQWGAVGTATVPKVTWTATVRFLSPGEGVGEAGVSETLTFPPLSTPPAADTLVMTESQKLSIQPPAGATLVAVTVGVGTVPSTATVVLYSAELLSGSTP